MSSPSVPLHISISENLRQQIEAGVYLPGEKLPSEHQLMAAFKVSRITVRRAVANLVNQGLAKTQQGRGVFVTPQQKVAYSLSRSLIFLEEDLARKGIQFGFENLAFRKICPPKIVQTALHLPDKVFAYLQKKLLMMDGAVGAVDVSYILAELGEQFNTQLKRRMTFPVLEDNGISIEHLDAVIECTHADYETGEYLDVPLGQPLIVYRYTAYNRSQQPILYGETISRADRFCYSLSLEK